MGRAACLLGFRENPFLCPFQLSEARWCPWLLAPSCAFKTSSVASYDVFFLASASAVTSFSQTPSCLPFSLITLVITLGPTGLSSMIFVFSNLDLNHIHRVLSASEVTFWGIRMWMCGCLWGRGRHGITLSTTSRNTRMHALQNLCVTH